MFLLVSVIFYAQSNSVVRTMKKLTLVKWLFEQLKLIYFQDTTKPAQRYTSDNS